MATESASKRARTDGLPSTFVEGFHDEEAVRNMRYRRFGGPFGDFQVSVLSLGASSLGSVFHATDEAESIEVVHTALKSGINLIDVAPWYGHGKAETVLGKALATVPREAYILTTKVGRYEPDVMSMFNFTRERVIKSVDESLARLGISYIDVIQPHDPEFAPSVDILVHETLPALEEVRKAGKVRHIGITGYPLSIQREIIEKSAVKISTALVYCHYSLNDTTVVDYLPYLKEKNIALIAASPISMGLLSHRGPPGWHPASAPIKAACKEAAAYCEAQGVNISSLAMFFSLDHEGIPTTLVSTASVKRIKANIAAAAKGVSLSAKEKKVLEHILKTYFAPLKGQETWEGVEVAKYWQEVGKAYVVKDLYGEKYAKVTKLSTE